MAVQYFGRCNEDGSLLSGYGADFYGDTSGYYNMGVTFTCPGDGDMTVVSLGLYCRMKSGESTGDFRIAIYDAGTETQDLLCQGTAAVTPTTTAGWFEHVAVSECTLTGGTDYHLYFSRDSANIEAAYKVGSAGDYGSNGTDRTGGFPATYYFDGSSSINYAVRCGVEGAAAAGNPYYYFAQQ